MASTPSDSSCQKAAGPSAPGKPAADADDGDRLVRGARADAVPGRFGGRGYSDGLVVSQVRARRSIVG